MSRAAFSFIAALSLAGWISTLTGCSPAPSTPPAQQASTEGPAHGEEGHVHEEGDEHGHEHGHPSEGPHHGHLIELGNEEYHAELTHDDDAGSVTIYILDSSAAKTVSIDQEEVTVNLTVDGAQQFKLAAAPQAGDKEGESSCFTSSDEGLFEAVEADASGRLNLTIAGKPYSGDIEHAHGEHEHDHEAHEHDHEE